jgi:hypothetical protein
LYRSGSCCVMQHRKHTPKTVNVRLPRYWKQDLIRGTQLCAVYSKFLGIDVWFLSVITVTLYDIVNLRLQPCANAVCSAFHHQQNMRLSQGSELRSGASCIKASAEVTCGTNISRLRMRMRSVAVRPKIVNYPSILHVSLAATKKKETDRDLHLQAESF